MEYGHGVPIRGPHQLMPHIRMRRFRVWGATEYIGGKLINLNHGISPAGFSDIVLRVIGKV